jgi:hypothetical protein
MKPKKQTEFSLQVQVCEYLRMQYPKALFKANFADGIKLSIGQATKLKRAGSGRAFPDLMIFEPRKASACAGSEVLGYLSPCYHGLFIELKREGEEVYERNFEAKSNRHLKEQHIMLCALRQRGYYCDFAVGFEQAKRVIDFYMNL